MNYVGGDFLEIHCSHPELGQMRFFPKANETYNVDFGGVTSNDDESQITSSGVMIDQMNNRRWAVDGPIAIDMRGSVEENYLGAVSTSPILGTWTFSHISGAIWRGLGKPVGARAFDTNAGTLPLKVSGSGRLEVIS